MPSELSPSSVASAFGQGHLFTFWDSLNPEERKALLNDVAAINFQRISSLLEVPQKQVSNIEERLLPPEDNICGCLAELRKSNPDSLSRYYETALKAINEGKVAVLLLAGGQGTRLGVNYPKGLYKPNLPSGRSLYQIQAEQIRRVQHLARQRFGSTPIIPWYIMTSEHTQETTVSYFASHNYFGHDPNNIIFFEQFTLPTLDFDGKVLMESKSRISFAPDGNGGLYRALRERHVLEDMRSRGVEFVQTYCVDNILVKLPDLHFIGFCMNKGAECGAQVVQKVNPKEPIGVLAMVDGRYQVIEYSEISPETAALRRSDDTDVLDGHLDAESTKNQRLVYSHGNICVHFFTRTFLNRVSQPERLDAMKHHVAKKKIPHVNLTTGQLVAPSVPNGVKFEQFIFDVFPLAERFAIWEVPRKERFSPLKNGPDATADCPQTSRADYLAYNAQLARNAGAVLVDSGSSMTDRREFNGLTSEAILEISPLVTYGGEDLECLNGVEIRGINVLELDELTGKPVIIPVTSEK